MGAGKPTAAFWLSLVGAILILLGAVQVFFFLLNGALYPSPNYALVPIFGVLVLLGSIMLYARPQQHNVWSIVVLVTSILSLIGAFWPIPGLVGGSLIGVGTLQGLVGGILGLVGGVLGIAWKPTASREASAV